MRISDWSSDVCSSDLSEFGDQSQRFRPQLAIVFECCIDDAAEAWRRQPFDDAIQPYAVFGKECDLQPRTVIAQFVDRSEEHTSELQSLIGISYAGLCLKQNT